MSLSSSLASVHATPRKPAPAELIARAREIGALARARAQQTEADRQVSPDMIARMRDAGLFRIMQPAAYGGFEYGFDVLVDVTAAIGAGCGSTGWVACFGIVHQWLGASFPKQAQDEFWADPNAIAAGSYAPVGKVVRADGGYRISGVWSFLSGCDNAQWFFVGGMIPADGGKSPPAAGFFLVPRGDVRIEDNWHVMGLAGTGSKNAVGTDVFVPAHRAVTFSELLTGTAPGGQVHANPLYRNPLLALLPYSLLAPILGIAEGALADFLDMAKVRATRGAVAGGNNRMAEFATIQTRVALAQANVDAARLMMLRDIAETCSATARGETISLDMRLRNRLHQAWCAKTLVQAVDALFEATGGQGIFDDRPIQRAWRDAHAAATHVSLNWDAVSTMYGQYALGLEPKGQY